MQEKKEKKKEKKNRDKLGSMGNLPLRLPAMLSVSLSFSAAERTFLKNSPHWVKLSSLPVS